VSLDETVEEDDLNELLAVFGCSVSAVSLFYCRTEIHMVFTGKNFQQIMTAKMHGGPKTAHFPMRHFHATVQDKIKRFSSKCLENSQD